MKKDQLFTILFWIGLGIFVMYSSCRFGLGSFRSPGPGLMPFLLGALLSLVAVYFLAASVFGKSAKKATESTENRGLSNTSIKKLLIVVVSLIVYAMVLEKLGYLIATLLLLFVLFWVAGTTKRVAAISSVVTVLLTYLLFTHLGVTFPQGILKYIGA